MNTCYIVGAGEFTARDFHPSENDFVIAADGGLKPLMELGVKPHLLLGDLDSLGAYPLPEDVPLEQFPVEKDDTDTGIALAQGYALGYRSFVLYGCSGGRADHLLANFQCMGRYARMGVQIKLVAADYDAYALSNGSLTLPHRPSGTTVSIFCHGSQAAGVSIKGLKYPLDRYTLTCDHPLGVSNEHTNQPAVISVEDGTLLILQHIAF